VHERELYWLRRGGGMMDATVDIGKLTRLPGLTPNTMRNIKTIRRLAAKAE
jgi:hypothetical protein